MPGIKRRWRISLRALLIAFTCAVIAVAIVARWAQQRRLAFAAIRKAGGDIQMGRGAPSRLEAWFGPELFGVLNKVDMRKGHADNALVAQIGVLKELRRLDLSDANIDDEGLRQIAHLPLQELWLQSTQITDASAATLSEIKTLQFLQLNATEVTDKFLERLDTFPALDNLGLRGTRVSGAGMQFLARHQNLKTLDVYNTAVDDAGVAALVSCQMLHDLGLSLTQVSTEVFGYLDKLPNLTTVDLNANRPITTADVIAFEKAHPQCDVEWYGN
jgi:hypothetical protein